MNKIEKFLSYVNGKRIALVGLGISNTPLIDFLTEAGAIVTGHDKKTYDKFDPEFIEKLEKKNVKLYLGEKYLDFFDEDIIIKAPGIRKDAGALPKAVENGSVLTSEMELFFALSDCEKFAITGSDGKTTTTTLIYLMLSEHYKNTDKKIYVGGNIGKPLLAQVKEIQNTDTAVLELSSFQLHAMEGRPDGAIITNVSPNHLDWHTDYDEYIDSKRRIFSYMDEGVLVLNYENDITREMAKDASIGPEIRFFTSGDVKDIPGNHLVVYTKNEQIFVREKDGSDTFIMNESDIIIPGRHNVQNYMAAIALLYGKTDTSVFKKIACSFSGVEHRCEFVREINGVNYYNSSIDSSPSRTMAALEAFKVKKVIAIMGGYDKNIPYDVMGDCVCKHTRAVVLTGATAPKIKKAIEECEYARTFTPEIHMIDDFKEAIECARSIALSGEAVVLTPASASFDKFRNFEERGNRFKDIVKSF